jgi:16S rRNA (uracil1498-N3)-methyltransferase
VSLVPFVHVDTTLAGGRAGDLLALDERDRHHLTTVLRLRPGAQVELSDGRGGQASAELRDDGVVLRTAAVQHEAPAPALRVAQGLPKGRKLDEVVRVCTELGVDTLIPVAARHSVTRLEGARASKAVDRWTSIARAASEQARRVWRPTVTAIEPATSLAADPGEVLLVAHPGGTPLPREVAGLAGVPGIVLAVGPEGGWSATETTTWEERGARIVGFGSTVLRTEHAAAAGLAVLAAALGRWER